MSGYNRRARHHIRNTARRLLIAPSLDYAIVDTPQTASRWSSGDTEGSPPNQLRRQRQRHPKGPRKRDPIGDRLRRERAIRELHDEFAQCTCDIRADLLKPVGQTLRFTTGLSQDGRLPNCADANSMTMFVPVELMDAEQRRSYGSIRGVNCWWCSYSIKGPVVGCPISHKRTRNPIPCTGDHRDIIPAFRFIGYFCSWPCARAYGNTFLDGPQREQLGYHLHGVLLHIVRKLRKEKILAQNFVVPHIRAAPHFSVLEKFGGCLTIDDFRRCTEVDNGKELTVLPDWIPAVPAGMRVTEAPTNPRGWAREYNIKVQENYRRPSSYGGTIATSVVTPMLTPSRRKAAISAVNARRHRAIIQRVGKMTPRRRTAANKHAVPPPPMITTDGDLVAHQRPPLNAIQMALHRHALAAEVDLPRSGTIGE